MLAFTLRRAIQAIGVMIAVGIISFSMFRFAGDPVNQIVSQDTTFAERVEIRKSLGLDDPVVVQFARYFANAAQFKFGVSYQFRQPVASLLKERIPATLELATCATILAMVFGILMGVYSALKRDTLLAKVFQMVSLIGISLPTFLIGILLIYLFAVILGWLPSFGRGEVVRIGWWTTGLLTVSGLKALILPSITRNAAAQRTSTGTPLAFPRPTECKLRTTASPPSATCSTSVWLSWKVSVSVAQKFRMACGPTQMLGSGNTEVFCQTASSWNPRVASSSSPRSIAS